MLYACFLCPLYAVCVCFAAPCMLSGCVEGGRGEEENSSHVGRQQAAVQRARSTARRPVLSATLTDRQETDEKARLPTAVHGHVTSVT